MRPIAIISTWTATTIQHGEEDNMKNKLQMEYDKFGCSVEDIGREASFHGKNLMIRDNLDNARHLLDSVKTEDRATAAAIRKLLARSMFAIDNIPENAQDRARKHNQGR